MTRHEPVEVIFENAPEGVPEASVDSRAPLLLTVEHASNFIPPALHNLGLPDDLIQDHVAWDIGALDVAKRMARILNAPLVAAPASRLLIDPNRDFDAHDLIPETAEGVPVPGNLRLTDAERAERIAAYHAPFHAGIETVLRAQPDIQALVSIHSFTPELLGEKRPWHVGVLYDSDTRMADEIYAYLRRDPALVVGRNKPYAPTQGVFYSMDRHAKGRAVVMIEVRNDLIGHAAGQERWSQILAGATAAALKGLAA